MNVLRKLTNKKGFSLIELMIVVAIIGILAAIALPNFTRFQRKARQSEAKGMLASYHTALKASAAEVGCYKGNFVAVGFQPEGELGYRLIAEDNAGCALPAAIAAITDTACFTTGDACDGIGANYVKSWTEKAAVSDGSSAEDVSNATYLTSATGDIGKGSPDEWTMNHNKTMSNAVSGL